MENSSPSPLLRSPPCSTALDKGNNIITFIPEFKAGIGGLDLRLYALFVVILLVIKSALLEVGAVLARV